MTSLLSSLSVSRSSGVSSSCWLSAGCRSGLGVLGVCLIWGSLGESEKVGQAAAMCPLSWHWKQSPFLTHSICFSGVSFIGLVLSVFVVLGSECFPRVLSLVVQVVMEKPGQSFLRCLICQYLRQSHSLMQHSRSLGVSLEIRGWGLVGF